MKPYATTLQMTTPSGWKTDNSRRRYRLFCGVYSSVIVVSMGILPPTPNPVKAVRTRMALNVLAIPIQGPNVLAISTVRLKAHFRPITSTAEQETRC